MMDDNNIEWRFRHIEERQNRYDNKFDQLDSAIEVLRADLHETKLLTKNIDGGLTQVHSRIDTIDSHLSDQDSILLSISKFIAETRTQASVSLQSVVLFIILPIILAICTFLLYKYWP